MNRTTIITRLRDVLSVDESLHGSDDSPAGTWPQKFGPTVHEWPDDTMERTALWLGDPRGVNATEAAWGGDGVTLWADTWAVDVWGSIGATTSAEAGELGEALIAAVRTIVARNRCLALEGEPSIDTLLGVSAGTADGPARFPAGDGGGVVATVRIEVIIQEEG